MTTAENEPTVDPERRERYIRKIKALFAKSNGGTEEEIHAALKKARELMSEFGITDDEIEMDRGSIPVGAVCIEQAPVLYDWQKHLAAVIASGFRCIVLVTRDADPNLWNLCLYGTEEDVMVAYTAYNYAKIAGLELWETFVAELDRRSRLQSDPTMRALARTTGLSLADIFYGVPSKHVLGKSSSEITEEERQSYFLGFGSGIEKAFADQNAQTALVLVTPALVRQSLVADFPGIEKETTEVENTDPFFARRGYADGIFYGKNKRSLGGESDDSDT